jgi:hypothetical protein
MASVDVRSVRPLMLWMVVDASGMIFFMKGRRDASAAQKRGEGEGEDEGKGERTEVSATVSISTNFTLHVPHPPHS